MHTAALRQSIVSDATEIPCVKVPRVIDILGWSEWTLTRGAPALAPAPGFALLWATSDLSIAHAGREAVLRAGDLTVIDRELGFDMRGAAGVQAHVLDLGDRRLGVRVAERHRFVAMALDGATPLAQAIKRLWAIGQDVGTMALGDDLVGARMLDIMGDLGGRLLAQQIDGRISSHAAAMLGRAKMLIATHLADPAFGPAALAAAMKVSLRHLSSLFAATGTTTSQAILDTRIAQAKTLLAEPASERRQIASIALACGFEDQSYFARCFRRETGMTPRRFRQERG